MFKESLAGFVVVFAIISTAHLTGSREGGFLLIYRIDFGLAAVITISGVEIAAVSKTIVSVSYAKRLGPLVSIADTHHSLA
jgi:hypothetical protein